MNQRSIFQQHIAQTSPSPMALDIIKAEGNYLYARDGKQYLDLIGGISVCNVGHGRKEVIDAINRQAKDYLHIMVYGELMQSPQTNYAQQIANLLPEVLSCVYFTNSGSEATEGAMKLAKRVTGKHEIIACNNSYHGSTQGSLSIIGDEYWRNAYRPLLPGIWHYEHNSQELIDAVNEKTACVIIEPIQAEVGIGIPTKEWMQQLSAKCKAVGALLIIDEIQCGFGRTGTMWGFEHFDIIPDVVLLGKALGGGMPLGAFVSSYEHMQAFTNNPVLGHITTFGGHPVSCAAGIAATNVIVNEQLLNDIPEKEALFHQLLKHKNIKAVRSKGLLMALELGSSEAVLSCIDKCLDKGLFTDWFLFAPHCIRIAPPLTISNAEIKTACEILTSCL